MAHKLIVGTTLSGKSTIAKMMVRDAARRGIVPVIYDPTLSAWESEFITCDEGEFIEILRYNYEDKRKIFAIIDEADTLLSMSHRHNWWLFMRGRHFGIECCAITQQPSGVAPAIRNNAADLFVFNTSKNYAEMLANDFSAPELSRAPELRQGEFLHSHWKDGKKVVDSMKAF